MPALENVPKLDPSIQRRIDELLANPPDGEELFAPATTTFDRSHPEYTPFPYDEGVAAYDALTESGVPLTEFDFNLKNAYEQDAKFRRLGQAAAENATSIDSKG